jgi:hypothetical protein
MKHKIIFLIVLFTLLPVSASAHVKWFTEIEAERAAIETIISPFFVITALICATLLAMLPQLIPRFQLDHDPEKVVKWVSVIQPYTFFIIQYGLAVTLVMQVLTHGLFAPELIAPEGILGWLVYVTIVLLLIPHRFTARAAGVLLLVQFAFTTYAHSFLHMMDYAFYLGMIFMLLFHKTRLMPFNLGILYLTTGVSLCWVAVEKWVYPGMSVSAIVNNDVPTFGIMPDTFAVMAGFIEFMVGYLLIVGILNRILSLVLTMIFISTTMLFGWLEIVGHFPIHLILFIFIIEGKSFYKPPIEHHSTRVGRMAFIFSNFLFAVAFLLLIYYRLA